MSVVFQDLGFKRSGSTFNLRAGEHSTITFAFQVPESIEPGDYLVKINVENNDLHQSADRQLTVE